MNKIFSFVFILAISLLLSYLFNFFFLKLSDRTSIDQFLLIFFLTCALAWIFYFIWMDGQHIKWDFRFSLTTQDLKENWVGIFLAILFFVIYFYYGSKLNDFGVGQVDNLFDADTGSWIRRIASDDVRDFEMRGPHPFTYFLFRPFGFIFNLFTDAPVISAGLFNSSVGGLCVFLAWLFIKRQFENKIYASLMAGLLAISTSHLFFGSVVDTYISSAFALILFYVLLQNNQKSNAGLILTGILTFGITLTNFVQNFIGFVISKPKIKEIFNFTAWVISISLILTLLHAVVYPKSKMFFLPSSVQNEEKFFAEYSETPDWRINGRTIYLTRTMFLYSVVAPKVFVLTDEVGSVIPEFRFYKISPQIFHQASYDGLGQILIMIWVLMLVVASMVFLLNLIRTKKIDISLSFILCLAFNWVLHFIYGQELFLYSTDWTYALIFFVAFGMAPFANNRFLQMGMLVFLILLAYHQWQFMDTILQAIFAFMNS